MSRDHADQEPVTNFDWVSITFADYQCRLSLSVSLCEIVAILVDFDLEGTRP